MAELVYAPAGPTLTAFHESAAFVRLIRGPVGSGKSTACVVELLRRAQLQRPGPDGQRKTRFGIVRNTYPELQSTTIKTWNLWAPQNVGRFTHSPMPRHHIVAGDLDVEVLFLALDRPEDIRKLLSLELTGAWVNEAREVPKAILDALTGRVGRFPQMAEGGPTWHGVLADTNPPDSDHYIYRLAETERPEGWAFFAQPPGDGPEAENLPNLPAGYYARMKAGKDEDWIRVYVRGEYGYVQEGKPVFPEWRDSVHVGDVEPAAELPLMIGVDFGLTPAAVFGQCLADGQWAILDELCAEDMGIQRFAELLNKRLAQRFPDHGPGAISIWADPAGSARAQTDERTAIAVLAENTGLKVRSAPTNDFTMRREAVGQALSRMIDGRPGVVLSPRCSMLRKGFSGGYAYKRVRIAGEERYHDAPDKNRFSHSADALQYLLLGGGEGHVVMGRRERRRRREAADDDTAIMMTDVHSFRVG